MRFRRLGNAEFVTTERLPVKVLTGSQLLGSPHVGHTHLVSFLLA